MNRSALKKYAPQARLDFIEAVTQRARKLGLDPSQPASIEKTGDVLLINGQPLPAKISAQRDLLATRIKQQGFDAVIEALAYTWFNRFAAIRFMELKGYFSHGFRVLSHPEVGHTQPEILEHVQHVELADLDKAEAIRLKTAGDQDEALYRAILIAQCHELYRNMPFLFEQLDDATELLLPDNLLRTDSVIAHLVDDIDEVDWEQVEIIGWLYQFYISEKKDQVIGKVVKSEDIPAATQLFTPNWIVKYLVQNSVGRLWLQANPHSTLANDMAYYIQPAEQTPEVQTQLDALIQTRIAEDGDTLNPESITVLDPACGSGHILVEAYDLLKAIYLERGYRLRDIPKLILKNNLFGLEIDDRAAQLAGFALLMKARADDHRLFADVPALHVMALQDSNQVDNERMANAVFDAAIAIEGGEALPSGQLFGGGQLSTQHSTGLKPNDLRELIQFFSYGKTFGSLLVVPPFMAANLPKISSLLEAVAQKGNELAKNYAWQFKEAYLKPAQLLCQKYDSVIANPPYMGGAGMNAMIKAFSKENFPDSKSDLFSMFMDRGLGFSRPHGFISMVTMQSWMFLSSYKILREKLLDKIMICTMAHLGAKAFSEISGEVVQTTAFSFQCGSVKAFKPVFFRLVEGREEEKSADLLGRKNCYCSLEQAALKKIPGSPLAFWVSSRIREIFENNPPLESYFPPRTGISTGKNEKYIFRWPEVDFKLIGLNQEKNGAYKYYPHNKGGDFRRWYGNQADVLKYSDSEIRNMEAEAGFRHDNSQYYFLPCVSWTKIASSYFNARYYPEGFTFNSASVAIFPERYEYMLGFFNSVVFAYLVGAISQTLNFTVGDIAKIPVVNTLSVEQFVFVSELVEIYRKDWDSHEFSWGFSGLPLVGFQSKYIGESWSIWCSERAALLTRGLELEELNNRLFIDIYALNEELSPDVSADQSRLDEPDREADMRRLISYVLGCVFGRYSLDEPGLIYAHSGNVGFDFSRYKTFPVDADGIIPITDEDWFDDDAANRVREFLKVVWGDATLTENMAWLAESLGQKGGETPEDTIRRYLSNSFYKDHLQTYKKRPIYWLFSSGKLGAFQALVYLHRHNEGTLSRMRMEYVVPLQSRMQARIDKLNDDIASASSSSQQKSLQKQKDKLIKQLEELRRFDENLRTYADKRISLDLDDGVKVNYGKFGDLLAEVKAVTGGDKED